MKNNIEQLQQFLSDEKEILTDLAHDVAVAESPYTYQKAKSSYDAQFARISGIQDSMQLVVEFNKVASK